MEQAVSQPQHEGADRRGRGVVRAVMKRWCVAGGVLPLCMPFTELLCSHRTLRAHRLVQIAERSCVTERTAVCLVASQQPREDRILHQIVVAAPSGLVHAHQDHRAVGPSLPPPPPLTALILSVGCSLRGRSGVSLECSAFRAGSPPSSRRKTEVPSRISNWSAHGCSCARLRTRPRRGCSVRFAAASPARFRGDTTGGRRSTEASAAPVRPARR
eukprot:scaffold92283_cov75-Phaeocystis_antarctica.AAC.7